MSTAHDVIRDNLIAAFRSDAVADAAGVPRAVWESATVPRVMAGDRAGFIGMLHRGRLPAVEIFEEDSSYVRQSFPGGTLNSVWTVRVHVGDRAVDAESLMRSIMLHGFVQVRANPLLPEGEESMGKATMEPLGHRLEASLTFFHAFGRDTYETT